MPRSEVWVAGGGMAGAVAALRARSLGVSVRLFSRGRGATALSSGAIDVASDLSAPPGSPEPLEVDPFAAASEVARTRPYHPYAVLRASLHRLREAVAFTAGALSDLFPVPGDRNLLLPTPLGTVKPTALAQWSQVNGDLRTLPSRVSLLELPQISSLDSRAVASGLAEVARGLGRGVEVSLLRVEAFGQRGDAAKTPADWAAHWEREGAVEALAAAIQAALPGGSEPIEALLLPPVLGMGTAMRRLARLLAPLRISELLAQAPSVPGLRLQASIDRALVAAGVGVERSELPTEKVSEAGALILATGKFLGGGLVREGGFRETILGLPLFVDGHWLPEVGTGADYVGRWLESNVAANHSAFRVGVRIDGALRPLGREGRPVRDRLFAVGSLLSGYDPASDKTGLGVALFTGFLAGEQAARAVLGNGI